MTDEKAQASPGSGARITVQVQLLNEGTIVYRETSATVLGPDVVRLEAMPDYDPEDEEWEFPPGSTVRVEQRMLSVGTRCVATKLMS